MIAPPLPDDVDSALARFAPPVRARLLAIRAVIFAVAARSETIGPLTETLKWGEPAYLTEATGSGTTVRLGVSKQAPGQGAVFVNCRTSLVSEFRAQFAEEFAYEGTRALILPADGPLPEGPLAICLHAALTYHRR